MKRILTLTVFPFVGIALLVTALMWCGRDLQLRFRGQAADGRIVGMALQRNGKNDLLTGLETNLTLILANGDRIEARYRDYTFESATRQAPGQGQARILSDIGDATDRTGSHLSQELRNLLADAVRGDAEIIRRLLLRESRRSEDRSRVIRIEKAETVHGYFDLLEIPVILGLKEGRIALDRLDGNAHPPGTAVVRAVFDFSNAQEVASNKGESLVEYVYLRNGAVITPAKKNFFLYAEPYTTRFFPVFGFEVNGNAMARLSHIGRQGGPTLALRLYEECLVYYDRENPAEAILIAKPGHADGKPLAWFSRLCEGFFGQWGSGSLIAIAGLGFLITGAMVISLVIRPGNFPNKDLHGL